jgi:hypothetical protein
MIYLLIYATCTINSGCSTYQHSGHNTEKECLLVLNKQKSYWATKKYPNTALSCIKVPGMNPESDTYYAIQGAAKRFNTGLYR